MSDIYDYAYAHILRRLEEDPCYENTMEESKLNVSHYEVSSEGSYSESEVNTADFSPKDLQIFVDCLEVIARLEKAKKADKTKSRAKKSKDSPKKIQVTCLDSTDCESLDEDDVNSFSDLSSLSDYIYDETYFQHPNQAQSTAIYSNVLYNKLLSTTTALASDSDDSGIFVNNTSGGHLYENIEPLKPKSKIVSYSKRKSLKARLISLFLKKQYKKTQILSSTTIGELNEEVKEPVVSEAKEIKKSSGKKIIEENPH